MVAKLERQLAMERADVAKLERQLVEARALARSALLLLRSVIKYGEPWTVEHARWLRGVLAQLKRPTDDE
jgi:hypothetical protein